MECFMTESLAGVVPYTPDQQRLVDVWEEHTRCEFEQKSVDHTMATMIDKEAYVNNVPTMTGGVGTDNVRFFYSHYFIPQLPDDTETVLLSRTVGNTQIVDELIFKFTHTIKMDWMLPNIAPTGKRVEVALVAIINFQNDKVAHEHIYWDQASVLVQLGLIDQNKLPVVGIEGSRKVVDPHAYPSNKLIDKSPVDKFK
jgi:carboxymethylenebutenolidase